MITATKRIIKSGVTNFARNGYVSLASVLVMVVALFFIGSIFFAQELLTTTVEQIEDKVDVNVYFHPDAPEEEVQQIAVQIEALEQVERVDYRSREEAIADFRADPRNAEISSAIDILDENPLGPSLRIKAVSPSLYTQVAAYLEENNLNGSDPNGIVDEVNFNNNKEAIENLTSIIGAVERAGVIIAAVLITISFLITFNTIRLAIFTARQEIHVMRLVGASASYIRGPFVVTGALYGLVASVITMLVFYPVTYWLGEKTVTFFDGLSLFSFYTDNFSTIFIYMAACGVVIGVISSFLAVRKYLRV